MLSGSIAATDDARVLRTVNAVDVDFFFDDADDGFLPLDVDEPLTFVVASEAAGVAGIAGGNSRRGGVEAAREATLTAPVKPVGWSFRYCERSSIGRGLAESREGLTPLVVNGTLVDRFF